jgi:hypothetical protein
MIYSVRNKGQDEQRKPGTTTTNRAIFSVRSIVSQTQPKIAANVKVSPSVTYHCNVALKAETRGCSRQFSDLMDSANDTRTETIIL